MNEPNPWIDHLRELYYKREARKKELEKMDKDFSFIDIIGSASFVTGAWLFFNVLIVGSLWVVLFGFYPDIPSIIPIALAGVVGASTAALLEYAPSEFNSNDAILYLAKPILGGVAGVAIHLGGEMIVPGTSVESVSMASFLVGLRSRQALESLAAIRN